MIQYTVELNLAKPKPLLSAALASAPQACSSASTDTRGAKHVGKHIELRPVRSFLTLSLNDCGLHSFLFIDSILPSICLMSRRNSHSKPGDPLFRLLLVLLLCPCVLLQDDGHPPLKKMRNGFSFFNFHLFLLRVVN